MENDIFERIIEQNGKNKYEKEKKGEREDCLIKNDA